MFVNYKIDWIVGMRTKLDNGGITHIAIFKPIGLR